MYSSFSYIIVFFWILFISKFSLCLLINNFSVSKIKMICQAIIRLMILISKRIYIIVIKSAQSRISCTIIMAKVTCAVGNSMLTIRVFQAIDIVYCKCTSFYQLCYEQEHENQYEVEKNSIVQFSFLLRLMLVRYNGNKIQLVYIMFKYIKLADFLQTLIHKKLQIKDLIYSQSQQNSGNDKKIHKVKVNPCVAYSNLSLVLNNLHKFQQMYQKICSLMKQKKQKVIGNKYLLFVMAAQYINVKKIVGGGKLKKIIMENLHLLPDIQVQSKINKNIVSIRLRKILQQTNYQQYQKWKKLLQEFGSEDNTIPFLFNLNHQKYSQLVGQHPILRTTSACIIQSFSSNLPPFLLFQGLINQNNMKRSFDIIDACSAPGNKTLQLSQYLGNRGTVYAFQKDERRYNNLCKNIKKYGAFNIIAQNKNFLQTDISNYRKSKLILLDPSCSGSGMLTNFTRDQIMQKEQQDVKKQTFQQFVDSRFQGLSGKEKQRIYSLKNFQLQLLNHAAKFNAQRISYSTCSIYRQQNQQVVRQFLLANQGYKIKNVTRNIKLHKSMYPGFGNKFKNCVRIDPRDKISDGFFVCIFYKIK